MTTKNIYSKVKHSPLNRNIKKSIHTFISVNKYFNQNEDQNCCLNMTFIYTMKEFKENLAIRFLSHVWLEAIDFSKWAIVGGCVLNALCRSAFPDTKQQDINLVYFVNDALGFKKSIDITVNNLNKIASQYSPKEIKVERIPGTPDYNVLLPCHVRLNFTWTNTLNAKNPLSFILHNFDMDICQVAFTGKSLCLLVILLICI